MGVKLDFFCCVAAELQDFKFGQETNSRLYFYRAFESQTIDDMLELGFFNEAQDLRVGDLILLYAPNQNRGYALAKVISTTNGIVSTQSIGLKAQDVAVDTDEFDRLSGENLQEVIEKADEQLNILWVHKADTILNFQTPITEDNLGATMAEIDALDNDLQAQITSNDADILKNTRDITALKGAGGALTAYNFNTATPTQETLTKYAVDQIWPGNTNWAWNAANPAASTFTDANGVARTAAEIFNSTWVNNTYDDHRWQLTNTQNTEPKVFEWADVGRDIVSVATATTAGIVRVGSGSQMVVNPTTGDISLNGAKAAAIRTTIGATTEWVRDIITEQMGGDFVQYWDSGNATDHSHARPGVSTPASGTWYRLYKSGWVEQGGAFSGNSPLSVTLPIAMANTAYSCFAGHGRKDGVNWNGNPITLAPESTTILGVYTYGDYQNMTGWWQVVGYAGGVSLFAYKATDGTVYYVGEIGMSDIDELILYMQDNEPGFLMQKNSSGGFDYVDYLPPIGITTSVLTIMLSTGGEIDCSRSPADDTLYYGK